MPNVNRNPTKANISSSDEKILELEYAYVKETVHQSIEDRYRMLNFYISLSTAAATIAIGVLTFSKGSITSEVITSVAFLALGIAMIGWLFLAMMIRLRQAWFESISALNKIKDYFIKNSNIPLSEAFIWEAKTIPRPERLWNIHFYSTLLIILLNSIFFCVALVLLLSLVFNGALYLLIAAPVLVCTIGIQIFLYKISLERNY